MSAATPVIQRLGNRDCVAATYGATTKYCYLTGAGSYSVQKDSSDPIGSTSVTFDGVNAGSEIRIYLPDGTEVAGVETCEANHILTWSVYAVGSPNNTVRIVIVHTAYKIKEFTYTSRIGAQSIPVQNEPDKWFSNPA